MQALSAQNTTLLPITTGAPEHYEPLWWYSGSYPYTNAGNTVAGGYFLSKGSNGLPVTADILLTLNSNWSASTNFAFEATLWLSTTASNIGYAALWDVTANAIVSASQISCSSGLTTATVIRSGKFQLTPGHSYAITVWKQNANSYDYVIDASLIIFPQ